MARGQWIKRGEAMGTIEAVISCSKTPNPSCANRPRRAIHRRSLAFRQRPFFDQHHTRPAPRAELHAVRLRRDEKASSGLALKPTDLPSLLTEQIALSVPKYGPRL